MSYKLTLKGDNAIKSRKMKREEDSRRPILIAQKAPPKISKRVREHNAIKKGYYPKGVPDIVSLSDE